MKLTYEKLCDIIDEAVATETNISIYMYGKDIYSIIDYLECEHGCYETKENVYPDSIKDGKIYYLDLMLDNDLHYTLDEAYYNGVLLGDDVGYIETTYIDNACNMTQLERIHSDKIFFDYVEDDVKEDDSIANCKCDNCKVKQQEYISKSTYIINGKEVDKETYDKKCKEFEEKFNKFESLFDTMLDDLLKSYL